MIISSLENVFVRIVNFHNVQLIIIIFELSGELKCFYLNLNFAALILYCLCLMFKKWNYFLIVAQAHINVTLLNFKFNVYLYTSMVLLIFKGEQIYFGFLCNKLDYFTSL